MRFEQQVAVVTGASLGIGRATAEGFARKGAHVALVSKNQERGLQAERELKASGYSVRFFPTDLALEQDIRRSIDAIVAEWGRIDILVNNAAVYIQADVTQTTLADWDRVMTTNLTSAFLCSHYVVPIMVHGGGGVIINVSSEAGLVGIKGQVVYNVSKAGLIALTKSCAVDLADRNIRVNCVCPGTTDTPLVREAVGRAADPAAARRALEQCRPMNRLGTSEEIASAVLYLSSAESGYATGAVFSLDGGYTAQ
ncbi:MAG: glucose 1-dehydrogenase [Anaerolineae bacterium]|nr:glucose 1-dehydrogenase [Anaerolineae bacterium]